MVALKTNSLEMILLTMTTKLYVGIVQTFGITELKEITGVTITEQILTVMV